jgi:hypothetical protein
MSDMDTGSNTAIFDDPQDQDDDEIRAMSRDIAFGDFQPLSSESPGHAFAALTLQMQSQGVPTAETDAVNRLRLHLQSPAKSA